uniref:BZIP domain-containing protein n=1 Tax=Plectus sambesii TaxID=2011161 RepID=A0A914WIA9_9BILA
MVPCGTLTRTPPSPCGVFYVLDSDNNWVEVFAHPASLPINALSSNGQETSSQPSPVTGAFVGGFTGDASFSPSSPADLADVEPFSATNPSFDWQLTVHHFPDQSSLNTPKPQLNDTTSLGSYPSENPDVKQQQQQQISTTPSPIDWGSLLNDEMSGPTAVVEANALDGQRGFEALHDQQALLKNGPSVVQLLNNDWSDALSQEELMRENVQVGDSIASQPDMGDGTIPNENVTTFMETTTDLQPHIEQMSNHATQMQTRMTAMGRGKEKANSLSTCLPSSSGAKPLSTDPKAVACRKSRAKRNDKAKQTEIDLEEANKKLQQKDKELQQKDRELQQLMRELIKRDHLESCNQKLRDEIAQLEAKKKEILQKSNTLSGPH